MTGESDDVFPAEDALFEDTFSTENTYRVCGQKIVLQQDYSASLGVSASVWDSALHLCHFFESSSLDLSGKHVIELGGGTGLIGIMAARLGAHVTITDLPLAISQIERNIAANAPPSGWPTDAPVASSLSWGFDQSRFSSRWDLVLGSDIVYMPENFSLLLDTLAHLSKDGAVVYLASAMRSEHGTQHFYDSMLPQTFTVELAQRDAQSNINVYKAVLK